MHDRLGPHRARGALSAARVAVAAWRIACTAAQVLRGLLIAALLFPALPEARRRGHVAAWSRGMLRALGIALETHGTPHAGATLVVANHVSWVDILAINAVHPVRFVSKADVRHWPLLGWLVACAGTLFIERERARDALRVVHQVAAALRGADTVAVFPEGTTTGGEDVLPFHANLLQAAIATGTPVQPVALRYADAACAVSPAAAYVGDTSLLASLWSVARARGLCVRLAWLTAEESAQADRRVLAAHLRGRIRDALGVTDCRSGA